MRNLPKLKITLAFAFYILVLRGVGGSGQEISFLSLFLKCLYTEKSMERKKEKMNNVPSVFSW